MSRRVIFPLRLDMFAPIDLNARNNALGQDGEMDLETLEVHVRQLQQAVGARYDENDFSSHEYRLRAAEGAIPTAGDGLGVTGSTFNILIDPANLEFVTVGGKKYVALKPDLIAIQSIQGKEGFAITASETTFNGDVTIFGGKVSATNRIEGRDGHGHFIDAPSFAGGWPNVRNGVYRFYCIDTANHIEIESPEAIASNRKQYLQDKSGIIPVEEADGMIGAASGFKVGGKQVVGQRLSPIPLPVPPILDVPIEGGYAFKTYEEMSDFVTWVGAINSALNEIIGAMVEHGLIDA